MIGPLVLGIRVPGFESLLRVPRIRILVLGALYWDFPIFGNYHIGVTKGLWRFVLRIL